jgi:hypothetical protein
MDDSRISSQEHAAAWHKALWMTKPRWLRLCKSGASARARCCVQLPRAAYTTEAANRHQRWYERDVGSHWLWLACKILFPEAECTVNCTKASSLHGRVRTINMSIRSGWNMSIRSGWSSEVQEERARWSHLACRGGGRRDSRSVGWICHSFLIVLAE